MAVDSVRVLTYNIRYILDRWFERRALVLQTLRDARADIIGLQEVNIGGKQQGQHKLISSALDMDAHVAPAALSYIMQLRIVRCFFSSFVGQLFLDLCAWFSERFLVRIVCLFTTPGELFARPIVGAAAYVLLGAAFTFGNVLLTCRDLPSNSHNPAVDTLLLGTGWRVASRAVIHSRQGKRIIVVNCHLQDGETERALRIRQEQVRLLVAWVNDFCDKLTQECKQDIPCLILGDFNGTPNEDSMAILRAAGFKSVYMDAHGCEPVETFHQHHECVGKDVGTARVTDYIWMRGPIDVAPGASSVALVGNTPKVGDATLWPSDHYGIVAELVLQ